MNKTTLTGILIGIGAIVLANAMEGGHFGALVQLTAAIIVFGGTAGAVIVANRSNDLKLGLHLFFVSFKKIDNVTAKEISQEIITCAQIVRAESLLAIEKRIKGFKSQYMKTVFRFLLDGASEEILKEVFEKEQEAYENRRLAGAKIWTDAGGYAPTVGILGAVLGLIHIMSQLTDTSALGKGIAIAFVATIYGVGSANLLFLPIAGKIKSQLAYEMDIKEMILEGALSILKGHNPAIIQEKLNPYLGLDNGEPD